MKYYICQYTCAEYGNGGSEIYWNIFHEIGLINGFLNDLGIMTVMSIPNDYGRI